MPKGKESAPWTASEIATLQEFIGYLAHNALNGPPADEQCPSALLEPYDGPTPDGLDNQFLSYTQLKGRVRTIFNDDWERGGTNRFLENIALFGGADFKTRFNETTQPSATFFSALDRLAINVGERAYVERTGPFAGFEGLPPPSDSRETFDSRYRNQIARLFRSILFRQPTETETEDSIKLIGSVFDEAEWIRTRDYVLGFELTVTDPQTGRSAVRNIPIPVRGDVTGVYQEFVDQSVESSVDSDLEAPSRTTLKKPILFKALDAGQRIVLQNISTWANVSFAAVQLRNLADDCRTEIKADDSIVRLEGAWKRRNRNGFVSYEDGNVEKGKSRIVVPITVPNDGNYEVSLFWRKNSENATHVLVEVFAGSDDQLAKSALPQTPSKGEAHFVFDSSEDTVPFAELEASFRFDGDDYLEINNTGTRDRVAAGAVDFVSSEDGSQFVVDSKEADGSDQWIEFKDGSFKAYNRQGTQLQDDNKAKGERFLRYHPAAKSGDDKGWHPDHFYKARIHYPGKRDNEQRVQVVVRASQSSPIVQVARTPLGIAGAFIEIDASASYTVQRGELEFAWKQTQGVPVEVRSTDPVLRVVAPRNDVEREAWVAWARALMRHPDFLFTRPPSLHETGSQKGKHRLQLVKLALDLVGRPPTESEFQSLEAGASTAELTDQYLDSQEFRDFYFHRIRLYLESQGTESQDEPARLWRYVAFNDRPFQEILTADYTVDANFHARPRPKYHGRTGVLTTKGFIEGKPGLPHFNYPAQVSMMFLGYVFEVPPEIVQQRDGITPLGTTDPTSACYSCHKILTPLAFQRTRWTDDGVYRLEDERGNKIDASDRGAVGEYPFKGEGMEAFATEAVKKERFIRTIINTHFNFYFGRSLHGNVDRIVKKSSSQEEKDKEIGAQDICAHWKVTSCAFVGGSVQGDRQFGAAGEKTLMAIPILADGSLDPNYDPFTGELRSGRQKHPDSFVPNHGDVYATALHLSGIDPAGRGRNTRPPMRFIKRS